jgi:hypothetical protein
MTRECKEISDESWVKLRRKMRQCMQRGLKNVGSGGYTTGEIKKREKKSSIGISEKQRVFFLFNV